MQKAVFIGADPQVAEIVRLAICLRWPNVTPMVATTGTVGLDLVKEESPDLVLLRPDLPDKSLTEVIRELREFSDVPLVVVNHQPNDLESVIALEAGADEYIQLPCELSELTFKVWSLMRRTEGRKSGEDEEPLIGGDLKVNPSTREVFIRGREVSLTPAEFQLTQLLVKNHGAVVSKGQIEKELAKAGLGGVGSVKQHIMRLRRKFEDDAKHPKWFANVPGVGYRIAFEELIRNSDVLVDNWGSGAFRRLGLGYDHLSEINPGLVYASITGYGDSDGLSGPYSGWPANNLAIQAMSGWMEITGDPDGPPQSVGDNIGDSIPGVWTALGIVLALETRRKTGRGQYVDMAMYECMVSHIESNMNSFQATGDNPGRSRDRLATAGITFKAKNGYVVLAGVRTEPRMRELRKVVGREDLLEGDARYLAGPGMDGQFYHEHIIPAIE